MVGVGGDLLDDGYAGLGVFDVVVRQDDGRLGCGLGGFLGSLGRGEGVLLDRFHHGGGDGLGDRLLCDGSYGFVCCWLGRDDLFGGDDFCRRGP